jgi:hypothetical protein
MTPYIVYKNTQEGKAIEDHLSKYSETLLRHFLKLQENRTLQVGNFLKG